MQGDFDFMNLVSRHIPTGPEDSGALSFANANLKRSHSAAMNTKANVELLLIELATVANWTATGTRTASLTLVVLEPVKRDRKSVV